MKMFDMFAEAFQEYCSDNNLDFNKVKGSPKCGNEMALFIQRVRNTNAGLENDAPAEILLLATKDAEGKITIEKFKGADEYLALDKAL